MPSIILKILDKLRVPESERWTEKSKEQEIDQEQRFYLKWKGHSTPAVRTHFERQPTWVNTCQIAFDLNQAQQSQTIHSSECTPEMCSFESYDLMILNKQEGYVVFSLWIIKCAKLDIISTFIYSSIHPSNISWELTECQTLTLHVLGIRPGRRDAEPVPRWKLNFNGARNYYDRN